MVHRIKFTLLIVLLSFCSCKHPDSSTEAPLTKLKQPIVDTEASQFTLPNLSHELKSLKDYRGKTVILNFWALWCAPCMAELPALSKMQQELSENGVSVVAINVDAPSKADEVRKTIKDNGYLFETLLDSEMTTVNNYGVTGFPETVFIDAEGKFFALRDPDEDILSTKFIRDREWGSETYLSIFRNYLADHK